MSNLDYFRTRLAQEAEAARTARCMEAEMIHRALATAYARRAWEELDKAESASAADKAGRNRSPRTLPD